MASKRTGDVLRLFRDRGEGLKEQQQGDSIIELLTIVEEIKRAFDQIDEPDIRRVQRRLGKILPRKSRSAPFTMKR